MLEELLQGDPGDKDTWNRANSRKRNSTCHSFLCHRIEKIALLICRIWCHAG